MPQIDGYNSDIRSEQVQKLAELFPEVVIEGKINWEKLKATLGEDIELGEKYGLGWKGKSNVFAKVQEKTVSTLHPQPEESVDWDTTQNMFIEGDNLEALKVLHKAYYGKIKMIYIDPPYNTGNDFVYNDDFRKTRREQALEEDAIDDEGNVMRDDGLRVNAGGHKHSNWLDMMYPRLFLARNLLRQDGVIFVSIDDNEVHNLRLMMNEIFGEENFVAQIVWQKRTSPDARLNLSAAHDYILVYGRNLEQTKSVLRKVTHSDDRLTQYKNPDNDPRGKWASVDMTGQIGHATSSQFYKIVTPGGREYQPPEGRCWAVAEATYNELVNDGRIWFGADGTLRPRIKKYLVESEGVNTWTWWPNSEVGHNQEATKEVKELFHGRVVFDYPKPVRLLKRILELSTSDEDIVLDFFSGSGSLAHATLELNAEDDNNRKWIMVQLPEDVDEKSEAYQLGYQTISKIARDRIRYAGSYIIDSGVLSLDKIQVRETPLDLGFRSYALGDSNFKKWNELVVDPDEIKQQAFDSLNPLEDGATDNSLLTEILLKRGVSPLTEAETHDNFVFVPSENLAISLSRYMTEELFAQILAKTPSQVILLDQAFRDDVNLKTNLILQAEKQNISVEVL